MKPLKKIILAVAILVVGMNASAQPDPGPTPKPGGVIAVEMNYLFKSLVNKNGSATLALSKTFNAFQLAIVKEAFKKEEEVDAA